MNARRGFRGTLVFALFAAVMAAGLLSACASKQGTLKSEVMVFAAMSLRQPFSQAAPLFEVENPGVLLQFNFSGSGVLAEQIASGAAADVFAPSGMREMDLLAGRGLIESDTRRVFAANSLVLIAPLNHSTALRGFGDLALPIVKRIAICDSRLAPAGLYAREAFEYYRIGDNISGKLIPCLQVAQACDYAVRGEVDAGVVYLTDFLARENELALIEQAPAAAHSKIEYPVAVMKNSVNRDNANSFIDFLCSEKGVKILSGYGFRAVFTGK